MTRKMNLVFFFLILLVVGALFAGVTEAQTVADNATVVVEQPTTVEEWLPAATTTLLAGIGIYIGIAIRFLAKHLIAMSPTMIRPLVEAYFDKRNQENLQKAITSAVGRIVLEGRWTSVEASLDEIKDHVFASVKDAVRYFALRQIGDPNTDKVIGTIAADKALEALKKVPAIENVHDKVKETLDRLDIDIDFNSKDKLAKALEGALKGRKVF